MPLHLENLSLARNGVRYLDRVDATFRRGRLTTVIGRTLAGKTTLLRTLAGLQAPDSGDLKLDGVSIASVPVWERDVAMVYQQFINYPHLSVLENVAFPLLRRGLKAPEAQLRAEATLAKVGLSGFAARRPSQLSGGQQQRVALARALAREAPILLLDEPLVNLDYKLREQLREEFRGLFAEETKAIVVYTTTEPAEAMMLGDEIVVMHEGRILQVGTPVDVFERPASTAVAEIVNDPPMNILPGAVVDGRIALGSYRLALPAHLSRLAAADYRFGLRATDLHVDPASEIAGSLVFAEISGSETFLHVETAFGPLALQIEGIHDIALGTQVPIGFSTERLFAFAADGALVVAP